MTGSKGKAISKSGLGNQVFEHGLVSNSDQDPLDNLLVSIFDCNLS